MSKFATIQKSNHPDIPDGTKITIRGKWKRGYVCTVRALFSDAYDLSKKKEEERDIWLLKKQIKFIG